jgi:multidrug efflux pump subunit AcrA (membrane-fusion protein)
MEIPVDARVKEESIQREETRSTTPHPTSNQAEESRGQLSKFMAAARDASHKYDKNALTSEKRSTVQQTSLARALLPLARRVATLAIALVAVLVSIVAWDHYLRAPWTRDGRIRVQVANMAPQVSGQIKEVRIADNQFVHKGDVLYVIDRFDFEVALRTNTAMLKQRAADLQVKEVQSERRRHLSDLATTPEEQQIFAGNAVQAKAAFELAQQQVAQAEINLNRTQVRSPVNGYVTNLLLRVGNYAQQGVVNVSIIDTDSYWIDGYFEETKMAHVCVGDRTEAQLIGYSLPIIGHVATVTWFDRVTTQVGTSLWDVFNGPSARPGCIPPVTTERGPTVSLPAEVAQPTPMPEQINPGLAPGIRASPRSN